MSPQFESFRSADTLFNTPPVRKMGRWGLGLCAVGAGCLVVARFYGAVPWTTWASVLLQVSLIAFLMFAPAKRYPRAANIFCAFMIAFQVIVIAAILWQLTHRHR